ncbi:UbiX family flavin prenyltransferase [Thermodesulfobacteriota bacterium]
MSEENLLKKRLVIGISGTTGVIYGIRLLEVLNNIKDIETHLIISEAGELCLAHETDQRLEDIKALADYNYGIHDIGAPISSGSFLIYGMVIIPCSMKTLSALANSYSENLIIRAGDVALKEQKKLVLVPRETPLHIGHLKNMVRAAEIGATILPPFPSFYHKPETVQDIIDHTIGRILDNLDIEHNLTPRWEGLADG